MIHTSRNILYFCLLSLCGFLLPYLHSWGSFPTSYVVTATTYFFVVLVIQAVTLTAILKKISSILISYILVALALASNLFFFSFLSSNWEKNELYGFAGLYIFILIFATRSRSGLRVICVFSILQFAFAISDLTTGTPSPYPSDFQNRTQSIPKIDDKPKNVYIIGVDAMVSREAKRILFRMPESEAYSWLLSHHFQLYDAISPGDQTLTTYGALLTGSPNVHPRTVRRLFNGTQDNQLYDLLKQYGYKRQFFYENDYFGAGPGKIENFRPTRPSFWSFCTFTDDRWGYYLCRALNKLIFRKDTKTISVQEKIQFYTENVKITTNDHWFSIGHIWFPGHTLAPYDASDKDQLEAFIKFYQAADKNLVEIFASIFFHIHTHDPDAIILFMGDHGTNLLRSTKPFVLENQKPEDMPRLKELDTRSVLWAVYPSNFCHSALSALKDSSQLLIQIANCAALSHGAGETYEGGLKSF